MALELSGGGQTGGLDEATGARTAATGSWAAAGARSATGRQSQRGSGDEDRQWGSDIVRQRPSRGYGAPASTREAIQLW